jgi:hypothetical protein
MKKLASTEEEVARLNQIITVLLDQINLLKKEISEMRSDGGIKQDKPSVVRSYEGSPQLNPSVVRLNSGLPQLNDSIVMSDNGSPQLIPSTVRSDNSSPQLNDSIVRSNGNSPQLIPSTVRSNNGLPQLNSSNVYPVNNATMYSESHSNTTIPPVEINEINYVRLGIKLRKYFHPRIRRESLYGLACELLLAHNNRAVTSEELRKASGLSESGFAKHFPFIKRKNFVRKVGIKKYGIGSEGIRLIQETFGQQPV